MSNDGQTTFSLPEPDDRILQAQLTRLHEVTVALSRTADLETLYRQAIVLGREKLGFDRLGLLLFDEETMMVHGTFGTDDTGQLRDERHYRVPISDTPRARQVIESQERIGYWLGGPLYDSWEVVGYGWNAMAVLWNGDRGIGWLATDNLLQGESIKPHQLDILLLYGSSLGHLLSQKRTEADLRKSQARLSALNTELEARVHERTKLLAQANEELQQEIEQRRAREAEIERMNRDLMLARDRALAASRSKSTFLANMSHEFRTPLNAIIGYAQLMAQDETLGGDNKESLETILRSGEHLLSLINNVLNLSKIEAGRMKFQPSTFSLLELLSTVGQMFNIQAREKGLDFVVQRRSSLPELIFTDQQKLRQVLINLLGNAVQYTAVGRVSLAVWITHRSGQQAILYLVVEDTGVGIAEDDMERLFLPFEQSGRLLAEAEGTGLGLAICHQFVQLLNGRLHVESEVGQGSRFTVELPISVGTAPLPSLESERRIVGVRPNEPDVEVRVLVVDDQEANRRMLELLLNRCHLSVESVSNGRDALEVVTIWRPDLIFMDIRMPLMDGLETTRRIRALPEVEKVPIVALTASVFEEERTKILANGCDAFVSKPFREEDIFKLLAHYLPVSLSYAIPSTTVANEPLPEVEVLPTAVRHDLYTAVCSAQGQQVLQIIAPLQSDQPQLVRQIRHLVNEFRYDVILDWLTEGSAL